MKEELVIAYQNVFGTDSGKQVLADLESAVGYHGKLFDDLSERNTTYNLGQREVVRYIHKYLNKKLFEKPRNEVVNEGINL